MKNITATFGTLGLLATMLVAPMAANASSNDRHAPRRSANHASLHVSIGSVVLGFLGLGGHNDSDGYGDGGWPRGSGYRDEQDRANRARVSSYAQRRGSQGNGSDQARWNGQSDSNARGGQVSRGNQNARGAQQRGNRGRG